MATGTLPPYFPQQFLDYSGTTPIIAAGYSLYQYILGTTTTQATFSNKTLTVVNTQPILLNSAGKCQMWLDPALLYTFVLKNPAGATIDTWDVTPNALPSTGSFVPLDGSTPMTGLLTLVGDATSNLNAVTKQQLDAAIASATASLNSLVATATAAAAAATAAAAAVKPTVFADGSETGAATTRDIQLEPGTYKVVLQTLAYKDSASNYTCAVSQTATVGTTTVSTSFTVERLGSGDPRKMYGHDLGVGVLIVNTAGTFTMAMSAATLNTATSLGSFLMLAKQ